MNLKQQYNTLQKRYGRQQWWPILESVESCVLSDEKRRYKSVYKIRKRLSESEMFEIAVGAILTQNTNWQNVEKALLNLKRQKLLAPAKILKTPAPRFKKLIRSSGYYNAKAKKLRVFSHWLVDNYQGDFKKFFCRPLEKCREELLNLWGIGPETADSILLYAGGKSVFVIDAYTKRLCRKFGVEFKTYDEYREYFEKRLPKSAKLFNEFHALIVAWGKEKLM